MANKRKIIFRADGNAEIGLGHITRSLALAEMLKDEFICVFATRFLTELQEQEIRKICSEIIHLQETDNHFNEFVSLLKGDEIVVLDNYFFDTLYQKKIKNKGCKLVCIDDLHNKHFAADIIINHAPQVKETDYSVESYTKLCLGLDYLLLRSVFLQSTRKSKTLQKIESVFICFGGSDPQNLTVKTVCQLMKIDSLKKVNVVVGQSYQYIELLKEAIKEDDRFHVYESLSEIQMINVMDVDIGVVPCSGILFECLAMKLPVITGYYVDNQKEIATYFKHTNIGIVVGDLNNIHLTEELMVQVGENAVDYVESLVDGNSGKRLKKVFQCLN